jgi:hypothetical protein
MPQTFWIRRRIAMEWPGEKVLIRVFEIIERFGIGVARPAQIRREGKARAEVRRYEELLDARTKRDVEAVLRGEATTNLPLLSRPNERVAPSAPQPNDIKVRREPWLVAFPAETSAAVVELAAFRERLDSVEKLLNLRAVHRMAEEEAEHFPDSPLPDERPTAEWRRAWRDGAERVEEETMRRLWARVLHGEAVAPGTYSVRTMETLRLLGRNEAQALAKVGARATGAYLLKVGNHSEGGVEGVSFHELLLLQECGMLEGVTGELNFNSEAGFQCGQQYVIDLPSLSCGWALRLVFANPATVKVGTHSVTAVGQQLIALGRFEPDRAYLRKVVERISKAVGMEASAVLLIRVETVPPHRIKSEEQL